MSEDVDRHAMKMAKKKAARDKIMATKTDEKGNIDLADLEEKVLAHSANLAALIVTYPSTHGVFESSIRQITALIHQHGGQVYMDGANMNAQVGLTNRQSSGPTCVTSICTRPLRFLMAEGAQA